MGGEGDEHAKIEITGLAHEVKKAEAMICRQLEVVRQISFPPVDPSWECKTMEIPKELIGETIGTSGCNLHAISEKSECKVRFVQATEFDKNAPEGKQVACIRGPPDK